MKKRLIALVLAASMLLVLSGCGENAVSGIPITPAGSQTTVEPLAAAKYPVQVQFPSADAYEDWEEYDKQWELWWEDARQRREGQVDSDVLADFLTAAVPELLTGTVGNEVCSPVNIYMALAMLSEVTHGNTRAEIFQALGVHSLQEMREKASAVWNTSYRDDGAVASILASSVWLNQDIEFVQETLDTLAQTYYASSYKGEMGSREMNQALRSWINEQTGGLLEAQAADLELSHETVLALASTVYFRAKWSEEFSPNRTTEGEFDILSPDGGTIPCEFMNSSRSDTYYWSDNFSAVSKRLENGGRMWFLRPDHEEGVSVSALLDDPTTMEFILADGNWENSKFLVVNLSVPKFDVAGEKDLSNALKRLGITDVFDPVAANFTPVTATEGVCVSEVDHAARVAIDEEGVTAAAYTVIQAPGAAMPPEEEVDFVLDKPFLFAITGETGLPLFMGVVQNPA